MNLIVKRFKGEIISRDYKSHCRQFLDQLSDNDNIWVCSGILSRYLKRNYDITVKEYYNLIIYGDKNYCPKCPYCGNDRKFVSISKGYTVTCGDSKCLSDTFSKNAKIQHSDPNSTLNIALNKLYEDPEFKVKVANNIGKFNEKSWKDEGYRKMMSENSYKTINNWKSKSIAKYKNFLSQGKLDDECIFYLGLTETDDVKFGVTSVNLDKGRCNRKWRLNLKSIHRAIIGTREKVAKIELEVKLYLETNSEYTDFSNLRKIIEFIKQFV